VKLLDPNETVVVVHGSAESALGRDRDLAFALQREIDARGNGHTYRRAVVVADAPFLERPQLHGHPTIAVGGPGVNAVAQQFVGELATAWQDEERSFVQIDLESEVKRATLWGMNGDATAQAIDAFIGQGMLDVFLDRIWRIRPSALV